ncbi:helix-turn-helix domain-containing protein [Salicibibacter kimchii]|uniref:PucR family transcriptional regulator n=1 Tax=Salicibibacter kimchii TaxID=2099786 RepID=A0A345C0N3_9BACI|nr:helix-turn-helix domain-containing protein [Salicibibacter kimchii]AXF56764.1 PucR family transcriptional regulator [Salicibibacter kimchii]
MESNKNQLQRNLTYKEDGFVYYEDRRSVVLPTSSFVLLREDLNCNIGKERTNGFLVRYGSGLGRLDARNVLKKFKHESIETIINKGPVYHQTHGHVMSELQKIKVEEKHDKISAYIEGTWKGSFEAEEYIKQFDKSIEPVCYLNVGYANGYLTEICNQTVLFKELSCVGKGDKECRWVGRTIDYWDDDMAEELKYYHQNPLTDELEITYEKLLEERNRLKNVSVIYNRLTEEILKGNDLQSLMEIVYKLTGVAILIEDAELNPLASGGISANKLMEINDKFKDYVLLEHNRSFFNQTQTIILNNHTRLVTPIFLKEEIIGYCSFLYDAAGNENENSSTLKVTIERISSICALYLLNKKTEKEVEERAKGRFLEQVLNGNYSKDDILRRSNFIGLDLFQPYYIVVVNVGTSHNNSKEELTLLEEVISQTSNYFKKEKIEMLAGQQSNYMVFLFSITNKMDVELACTRLLSYLNDRYSSVPFRAGISIKSDQINNASNSYREALTAVRMTSRNNTLISFNSLGIIGTLINTKNPEEVEKIAKHTLQPLFKNYDYKKMEMIKTLYFYLLNGGNLEQTAFDLALSLSGIRYRLTKIEELLGQDLRNPKVTYQLLLSIQALISIGELNL